MNTLENKKLNQTQIKYILIILMAFDHIIPFFPEQKVFCAVVATVSRLVAPLMVYFITEGCRYTRNAKKYLMRLFVFSLISIIPWSLRQNLITADGKAFIMFEAGRTAGQSGLHFYLGFIDKTVSLIPTLLIPTSVIFNLFLCAANIIIWDRTKIPTAFKVLITLSFLWMSSMCNWLYYPLLMSMIFWFLREKPVAMWSSFSAVGLLYGFGARLLANPFRFGPSINIDPTKFGIFLTIPVMLFLYNHKRGKSTAFSKWSFYVFYPAHLLIIYILFKFVF